MLEIKGVVKHDDWGGLHHIPLMLSQNYPGKKCSELLFTGSRTNVVRLVDGSNFLDWLKVAPEARLGSAVISDFGTVLPFSVKLVDVNTPQTVCVFPGVSDAKLGCNPKNVLHNDFEPIYSDSQGRFSLLIASTEMMLLSGFLTEKEILERLDYFDMLSEIWEVFKEYGVKGGITFILRIDEAYAEALITKVYEAYFARFDNSEISTQENLYWFLKGVKYRLENKERLAPDLLLMLFMNLRRVAPQDVVFVDSNCAFAVLYGCYFELSTSSNNVITPSLSNRSKSSEFLKLIDVSKSVSDPLPPYFTETQLSDYRVGGCHLRATRFTLNSEQMISIPNQEFPSVWLVSEGEVMFNTQQHYSYPGAALYQRPQEFNTVSATHDSIIYRFSIV